MLKESYLSDTKLAAMELQNILISEKNDGCVKGTLLTITITKQLLIST
jgi:hypothetical protein